jgi:hypothetical protein
MQFRGGPTHCSGSRHFGIFAHHVVQLLTIQLLQLVAITSSLATKLIDYVSAFWQTTIIDDVSIDLPCGCKTFNNLGTKENCKPGHVFKLN